MSKRADDPGDPKPTAPVAPSSGADEGGSSGGDGGDGAGAITGGTPSETAPPDRSSDRGEGAEGEFSTEGRDVLFAYGKTEAGDGYRVVRSRENRLEIGELRELSQHKPIHGDLVKLSPVEGVDKLYDVEVLLESAKTRTTTGPPRVSNALYRERWEDIFGGEPSDPSELN